MIPGSKPTRVWLAVDATVLAICLWLAFLLRYDFRLPQDVLRGVAIITPFVLALQVTAAYRYRVHRVIGRYVSVDDLPAFMRAAGIWLVPMVGARLIAPEGPWRIPLSVTFMDTVLAVFGLISVRLGSPFLPGRS